MKKRQRHEWENINKGGSLGHHNENQPLRMLANGRGRPNRMGQKITCRVCGGPHETGGYAHPTKCWKCAPTILPLKHGVRKLDAMNPRKTRKG